VRRGRAFFAFYKSSFNLRMRRLRERVGEGLAVFTGPLRWRPAGTNNT
jgi:hypothetical protein